MQDRNFKDVYKGSFLSHWNRVATFTKPIIAAVNGYAVSTLFTTVLFSYYLAEVIRVNINKIYVHASLRFYR